MKRPADSDPSSSSSSSSTDRKIAKIIATKSPTPLDSLTSNNEPLSQDDIIYFQKSAIWRLLNLQYLKSNNLLERLKLMDDQYSKISIFNTLLIQWWFQILSNMKNLGYQVNSDNNDHDDADEILISLNNINIQISPDELTNKLNTLHKHLVSILSAIIKPNSDTVPLLTLQNQISTLTANNNHLNNENSLLKLNIDQLNNELDSIVKKLDRLNSKSIKRVKKEEEQEEEEEDQQEPDVQSHHTGVKTETLLSQQSPSQPSESVDSTLFNDLNLKISSLNGINESLKSQLDEKIKAITNLENSILELKLKKDEIPDTSMKDENSKLLESNKLIEFENEKFKNQLFELESKFSINKLKIESKFDNDNNNNNLLIEKLENDLNRIRNDRDSLLSKLNILKNEKGKNEYVESLIKLTDILKLRIDELEKIQSSNLETLSSNDHNKILVNELKQIETAFKSIREISISKLLKVTEYETLINKLTVEKSKADEKYFQAMRLKDSLSSQNKILSTNLNKQMELIEILKINEVENLKKIQLNDEKLQNNLKKIELLYNNEIEGLKSKLSKIETSLISKSSLEIQLRAEISKYQSQIQKLDKELSTTKQKLSSESNQLKLLKSNKSTATTNKNTTADSSNDEIQEALLSMTKCSLCLKNFKNIALKTCGHCFCKDCVDDRLNARMRKCPNCNSQFSRYDLLNIHL